MTKQEHGLYESFIGPARSTAYCRCGYRARGGSLLEVQQTIEMHAEHENARQRAAGWSARTYKLWTVTYGTPPELGQKFVEADSAEDAIDKFRQGFPRARVEGVHHAGELLRVYEHSVSIDPGILGPDNPVYRSSRPGEHWWRHFGGRTSAPGS